MKYTNLRREEPYGAEGLANFTNYTKDLVDSVREAAVQLPVTNLGPESTSYYKNEEIEGARLEASALLFEESIILKRYFYSAPKDISLEAISYLTGPTPSFEFSYEENSRLTTSYLELKIGARGNTLTTGGIMQGIGHNFVLAEYKNEINPFSAEGSISNSQFKICKLKVFPMGGMVIIGRSLIHITPPHMSPVSGKQPIETAKDWLETTEISGIDITTFISSSLRGHQDIDASILLPELRGVSRLDIRDLSWMEPTIDLDFTEDGENLEK